MLDAGWESEMPTPKLQRLIAQPVAPAVFFAMSAARDNIFASMS
jgi:hypothetical protein